MRNALAPRLLVATGVGLAAVAPQPSPATPVDPEILRRIEPKATTNPGLSKRQLVEKGRVLFFEETFEGNGRTCGTCHPATNNFTIDPAFIATLPDDDPLFVAEFNPDLAELENPDLLREAGLILENLDGFDRPGVMRGVPHNLGMPMSIRPDPENPLPGPEGDRVHALGWSGDGSPGTGSLREFAIGAIVQHFPKTLAREPEVDFRLPNSDELDALESFMMSVGRQKEVDLATMTFSDERVEHGKLLFNNEDEVDDRSCSACHANAGANNGDGFNRNFDTGTRLLTRVRWGDDAPPDGGLGPDHQEGVDGFGDGTMNTPSLIEAADTAPFFHNNSKTTLEDAIAFYASDEFTAGDRGRFQFTPEDVEDVGALLRTLSALENIRHGNVLSEAAQRTVPPSAADERIEEVIAETEDAIDVLSDGPLELYPDALGGLQQALNLEREALDITSRRHRNASLRKAISLKEDAGDMMLEPAGDDLEAVAGAG